MKAAHRSLVTFPARAWKLTGAFFCALGLTAFLGLAIPVYAMPIHGLGVMNPNDPQNDKCKPHLGKGINPHCPPPVVPEAPMAVLLPLSAAAILGIGYVALRNRPQVEST